MPSAFHGCDRDTEFATSYSAAHQLVNTRTAAAVAECLEIPLPEGVFSVEFSKRREEERGGTGQGREGDGGASPGHYAPNARPRVGRIRTGTL